MVDIHPALRPDTNKFNQPGYIEKNTHADSRPGPRVARALTLANVSSLLMDVEIALAGLRLQSSARAHSAGTAIGPLDEHHAFDHVPTEPADGKVSIPADIPPDTSLSCTSHFHSSTNSGALFHSETPRHTLAKNKSCQPRSTKQAPMLPPISETSLTSSPRPRSTVCGASDSACDDSPPSLSRNSLSISSRHSYNSSLEDARHCSIFAPSSSYTSPLILDPENSMDLSPESSQLKSPIRVKGPARLALQLRIGDDQSFDEESPRPAYDMARLGPSSLSKLGAHSQRLATQLRDLIKKTTSLHLSPIIEATKANDLSTLQRLLKTHTTNPTDSAGYTALHHAGALGYTAIAGALLVRNAQTTVVTKARRRTPLHLAAQAGHATLCAMLLAFGADPAIASDLDGATALHLAALAGHADCITVLINGGALVDARDKERMTPLVWAAQGAHVPAARALLRAGACANTRVASGVNLELSARSGGPTVLQKAVSAGSYAFVRLLLAHGAETDASGPNGVRALHRAAGRGDLLAVEMLLQAGAYVDALTEDSWTPLHNAAWAGHEHVYRALIRAGARMDMRTSRGVSVKEMVQRHEFWDVL